MWQVVSGTANLLSDCDLQAVARTVAGAGKRKCYTRDGDRRSDQPRSGCAINAAVEVIGGRWSLLVLRDVMFGNRRRFRILQERCEEGIASNILADRLQRLVADGLLTRAQARPASRKVSSTAFDEMHANLYAGERMQLEQRRTEQLLRNDAGDAASPRSEIDWIICSGAIVRSCALRPARWIGVGGAGSVGIAAYCCA
jgi:DNA-binding HxlR family transcriptional regulator